MGWDCKDTYSESDADAIPKDARSSTEIFSWDAALGLHPCLQASLCL